MYEGILSHHQRRVKQQEEILKKYPQAEVLLQTHNILDLHYLNSCRTFSDPITVVKESLGVLKNLFSSNVFIINI